MNCYTERDKFRCTRFINIFNSKDEAIRKLDNTSRYYGEPVMIKYRDESGYTKVMLALYKSEAKGDYEIFYQQVKDNLVKKLELKINENSKLDADECFANFFNYIEQNENKDFNINNSSNKS